jgi:hypothetical protein
MVVVTDNAQLLAAPLVANSFVIIKSLQLNKQLQRLIEELESCYFLPGKPLQR